MLVAVVALYLAELLDRAVLVVVVMAVNKIPLYQQQRDQ
jgi:hypothetical protein